jgi:thiamine biosynthesis lipoprotein
MSAAATLIAAALARFLMGTVCEVAADRPEQIEAAFAEAKRIEGMLSTWTDESELSRVNRGAAPSPELRRLLDTAIDWSARTGHAFDPRIAHLLERTRGKVRDGAFEEGAFGKGYALDRMLALVDGESMINFGGQIAVRGTHEVSIADPADRAHAVVALTITDASLSTSAGSHILDPRTGKAMPAWGSASVIARDALLADILSTALYVMGSDEGPRWAAANDIAAIFIDTNKTIRLSPAARKAGVTVIDRDFSIKD